MLPVLFSIGQLNVSSFGLFLALAFLWAVFLVWRLSRAWDLDEEKILDLTLLTFLGGLTLARIYFGIEHWSFFSADPLRLILVNKYPGFSFWGGFLGGWLALYFFVRRFRLDFTSVLDIAAVGFLGGLIFGDIGCLLGGCDIGVKSSFLAVTMVGAVGKRIPIQAIEAILLLLSLLKIWSKATHFHLRGSVVAMTLIYIGIIKLLTENFKQVHSGGYLFSLTLIIVGVTIFYKIQGGKRTPVSDLHQALLLSTGLIKDKQVRNSLIQRLGKSWYNQKTAFLWKVRNFTKLLRKVNVKISPKT